MKLERAIYHRCKVSLWNPLLPLGAIFRTIKTLRRLPQWLKTKQKKLLKGLKFLVDDNRI